MPSADYVIVGAGSAGCVLANRLTEDPSVRVLVLEAGGSDRHPNILIPAAFAKQFRTKLDWAIDSEPEPDCNGRSLFIPRGKTLGGSSSMNAQLYVRGRPLDYDLWEAQGAAGWGWDDVLPYFLKSEDNARGASEHHAVGGPLRVQDERSPRPLTKRFLAAAEAAGIPYVDDYNGPEQDGAALAQVTQKHGRRWGAADAYLRPAMKRDNLEVVTHAHATGLVLSGDRVTGVRYRDKKGREHTAHASTEVLLCAGAIQSPQLLMLSGLGPADELAAHGITVRAELPGVGRNLQDHPYVVSIWEVTGGSLFDAEHPRHLAEWLVRRSGPLTSTVGEAFAFVRSRPGLPAPDLQYHFAPAYFEDNGFAEFDGHAITLGPTLITPKARGEVTLRSTDPLAKPRVLTRTLSEPDDVAALIAGMQLSREIASQGPLREVTKRELLPGDGVRTPEDLEADLRNRVQLLYHPTGTCRIGVDEDAVVDPELRVRGVEGLRVVDASVFPVIPGGNTNAAAIMVGERAADLIRGRVAAPGVLA